MIILYLNSRPRYI